MRWDNISKVKWGRFGEYFFPVQYDLTDVITGADSNTFYCSVWIGEDHVRMENRVLPKDARSKITTQTVESALPIKTTAETIRSHRGSEVCNRQTQSNYRQYRPPMNSKRTSRRPHGHVSPRTSTSSSRLSRKPSGGGFRIGKRKSNRLQRSTAPRTHRSRTLSGKPLRYHDLGRRLAPIEEAAASSSPVSLTYVLILRCCCCSHAIF